MAQELTFNISEDRRKLQGPVEAKDFNLKFGTDGVAITHGNPKQWVQGRIGDDQLKQVFVNITEGEGNTPKDVAGMFLAFVGIIHDKDGRPHRVVDYKHSTTIDVEHGRFRFDFPDQAFTVAGEYQQAFFMLIKEGPGGGCVATMEFDMQVMANFVFTDLVPEDYITPFNDTVDQLLAACKKFKEDTAADEAKFKQELDDAYAKFQKDTNTQFSNFKDATDDDLAKFKKANADDIANFKQQYADAVKAKQDELQNIVNNYTDKIDTLLKDLNQQGIDTSTLLTDLRSQMAALQDKIKQSEFFTQAEADAFKQTITDQVDQKVDAAINEVKAYALVTPNVRKQISYNGYWSNLDQSHSGGVYTSSLDSIKNEIDQMAPLVDGVTLIFRQYITGGKLTLLENLDTFKQAVAYAKSKGLTITGYKFHCVTPVDDIKAYGVSEFFTDYKANVDKVTSALPDAGVPLILFNERGDLYGSTSPYAGNVRSVMQDLVGETFKVDISFQSFEDFISADPHIQEMVDSIMINIYGRISDKKQRTTLQDVVVGTDVSFYNRALYVHSLYPDKPMNISEYGIKNNWAAFDETWSWVFSSVYDDPTGTVPYIYMRGLLQSDTIKLFSGVSLWFYADLLQSDAAKEYLRAYKKGVI